jgi:indolepyruvate ferredoxin oxidoreductase
MFPVFDVLSKLKFLRGTPFDPFGWTAERKAERRLIVEYEQTIAELLQALNDRNHTLAVEIASLPEYVKGYGFIKRRSIEDTKAKLDGLITCLHNPSAESEAA